jgi:hypothetical protein
VSNRSRRTATSSTAVSTTTTTTTEPANFFSEPAVTQYLAERSGNITAALYDVTTGTLSLWRPGVDEDTASIVKVDTLATLLHQDQTSGTSLSANEESLATSMIEISDNDAATDLWDDAGQATGIGSFDSLLELNSTVPGSDGYWGLTQTTASDQIELPQSLVLPNQVLDAGSRAYELGLMEQVTSPEDWGVSSGVRLAGRIRRFSGEPQTATGREPLGSPTSWRRHRPAGCARDWRRTRHADQRRASLPRAGRSSLGRRRAMGRRCEA